MPGRQALGSVILLPEYSSTNPATPASGLQFFTRTRGRPTPAVLDKYGHDYQLQAHQGTNRFLWWIPVMGTTTIQGGGLAINAISNGTAVSSTLQASNGIATTPSVSTQLSEVSRVRIASTTTAGTSGSVRGSALGHYLSTTAGRGGFDLRMRFGFASVPNTGSRCFVGSHASVNQIIATSDPTALLNMVGVGWNAADTPALYLMTNDGSGTATKTAIANHTSLVANDIYELSLYSPPGFGGMIVWTLRTISANVVTSGIISADLPALGTMMTPHFAIGNGSLASQQLLDFVCMTLETDN